MNTRKFRFLLIFSFLFIAVIIYYLIRLVELRKSSSHHGMPILFTTIQTIRLNYPCIPSPESYQIGLVTRVVDGDSIRVRIDQNEFDLRYIGIDAPEMVGHNLKAGRLAKEANKVLVGDKAVLLFRDVSETDQYGRLLRYVFVEDEFINFRLIRDGHAIPKSYPPDMACQEILFSAEK